MPTLLCSVPLECYSESLVNIYRSYEESEYNVRQTVGENFSETSYCFRKISPDDTNG